MTTRQEKINQMLEGYTDGLTARDFEPPNFRSLAYKFGWENGRDDRLKKPREKADVLRRRADMILGVENETHS